MAKSRKSSSDDAPKSGSSSDERNIIQFFVEEVEGFCEQPHSEPVNHVPYVDVHTTEEELVVEIEIPGVTLNEIDISVFKSTLNLRAAKFDCFEENTINYTCMERSFGRLFRTIDLPVPVNTSKVKAVYSKGILKVTMPRVSEKRGQPKKIKVETDK